MPNAWATDPASFPSAPVRRSDPGAPAARSTFADALTFAYDLAYRAPGSLSLALRAAYGLEGANVVDRAQLGNASRPDMPHVVGRAQLGAGNANDVARRDVARRAQLGDTRRDVDSNVARPAQLGITSRPDVPHVVGRAQLGNTSRPPHPYFRFNARADGLDIGFVVVRGRMFAGVRSWTG